jgi:hypothetical protein
MNGDILRIYVRLHIAGLWIERQWKCAFGRTYLCDTYHFSFSGLLKKCGGPRIVVTDLNTSWRRRVHLPRGYCRRSVRCTSSDHNHSVAHPSGCLSPEVCTLTLTATTTALLWKSVATFRFQMRFYSDLGNLPTRRGHSTGETTVIWWCFLVSLEDCLLINGV